MRVHVLLDNTALNPDFLSSHGLSLYIESQDKHLIVDFGDNDAFLANAKHLGLDLGRVDYGVVSHGHYDHGGGLAGFLKLNNHAPIYVRENAFEDYVALSDGGSESIGLAPELAQEAQIKLLPSYYEISERALLFSGVETKEYYPTANRILCKKEGKGYVPDDFSHEQYLLLEEEGKHYLFSGCAHKGIFNILQAAEKIAGGPITACFSGFHLYNPLDGKSETDELLASLAEDLKTSGTLFYTGHCTGSYAYEALKAIMGDQVRPMPAGSTLTL